MKELIDPHDLRVLTLEEWKKYWNPREKPKNKKE